MLFVIIAKPLVWAERNYGNGFLEEFMTDTSLTVMGTMLAIYIATASSFLAILIAYEKEEGATIFNKTSTEIRQNVLLVIALFALQLILLTSTPNKTNDNQEIILCLLEAKTLIFSIYIYALYELSQVLFGIRDAFTKGKK